MTEWNANPVGVVGRMKMDRIVVLDRPVPPDADSSVSVMSESLVPGGLLNHAGSALTRYGATVRWIGTIPDEAREVLSSTIEMGQDHTYRDIDAGPVTVLVSTGWRSILSNPKPHYPIAPWPKPTDVDGLGALLIDGWTLLPHRWEHEIEEMARMAKAMNAFNGHQFPIVVSLPSDKAILSQGKAEFMSALQEIEPTHICGTQQEHNAASTSRIKSAHRIITAGRDPIVVRPAKGRTFQVPVRLVDTEDTVGAGDIFAAGVALAASRDANLTDSVHVARDLVSFNLLSR